VQVWVPLGAGEEEEEEEEEELVLAQGQGLRMVGGVGQEGQCG
jgi:hypothetical protein